MSIKARLSDPWFFTLLLLLSICLGGLTGYLIGPRVQYLKPLGDLFLNLLLSAIVPLVFFSVSSAIANTSSIKKLGHILFYMLLVFLLTGTVAAVYALCVVTLFPPALGVSMAVNAPAVVQDPDLLNQLANIFTVSDFSELFSQRHILALIVFAALLGLGVATTDDEQGKRFADFLKAGERIFMRVFSLIMYIAPIGFFAWFAVLVNDFGTRLMGSYLRLTLIYYASGMVYFFLVYSMFAYLSAQKAGVKLFWKNASIPAMTALATCSSAASIPANLAAMKNMHVPAEIRETLAPLGAIIHKDGSVIGGMFKIAFLFGMFHLGFDGLSTLGTAILVSLMVGTIMGAIPGGGMLGELLILKVYGLPDSMLIIIVAISMIIDPLATLLNVSGNTVSSLLLTRMVEGKYWLANKMHN